MANKKVRVVYKDAQEMKPADDSITPEVIEKICIKDKTDPDKEKIVRKHRV